MERLALKKRRIDSFISIKLYLNYNKLKNKTLSILFFLSAIAYGQEQEFKKEFLNDVCECLNKSNGVGLNTLQSCFSNKITNYQKELEKFVDKDSKLSEYEQGQILGQKLFFEMQRDLIQKCDIYYEYFENLREQSIVSMKASYNQKTIDSINNELSKNKSIDLMWEKGNIYFMNNQLEKAKNQYYKCLEINPNHIQSIFFLGWTKEREGNYKEAIDLYESVYNATKKQEISMIIELVKRKSKE